MVRSLTIILVINLIQFDPCEKWLKWKQTVQFILIILSLKTSKVKKTKLKCPEFDLWASKIAWPPKFPWRFIFKPFPFIKWKPGAVASNSFLFYSVYRSSSILSSFHTMPNDVKGKKNNTHMDVVTGCVEEAFKLANDWIL